MKIITLRHQTEDVTTRVTSPHARHHRMRGITACAIPSYATGTAPGSSDQHRARRSSRPAVSRGEPGIGARQAMTGHRRPGQATASHEHEP
jgi:hypothetical protein